MDSVADDSFTYLCNASRSFALFNNCVCYSVCYIYVYYGRQYFLQWNTDFKNSLILFFESVNTTEKIYFLLSMCLLILMISMIFVNHKFRSKSKPNIFTIKLWLIVYRVFFYFVLVSYTIPSVFTITKRYDVVLIGIIVGAILAYEIYVVKCLYAEICLQNTSILDLIINLSSMRHSAQSTDQNSHLAVVHSTNVLMSYFLWIFFILRKRINPVPSNSVSIRV